MTTAVVIIYTLDINPQVVIYITILLSTFPITQTVAVRTSEGQDRAGVAADGKASQD